MKPKLGPNVIMRLKFDFSGTGSAVATTSTGGNGYSKLSGTDDDGPKSIQMVSFPTRTATDTAAAVVGSAIDAAAVVVSANDAASAAVVSASDVSAAVGSASDAAASVEALSPEETSAQN